MIDGRRRLVLAAVAAALPLGLEPGRALDAAYAVVDDRLARLADVDDGVRRVVRAEPVGALAVAGRGPPAPAATPASRRRCRPRRSPLVVGAVLAVARRRPSAGRRRPSRRRSRPWRCRRRRSPPAPPRPPRPRRPRRRRLRRGAARAPRSSVLVELGWRRVRRRSSVVVDRRSAAVGRAAPRAAAAAGPARPAVAGTGRPGRRPRPRPSPASVGPRAAASVERDRGRGPAAPTGAARRRRRPPRRVALRWRPARPERRSAAGLAAAAFLRVRLAGAGDRRPVVAAGSVAGRRRPAAVAGARRSVRWPSTGSAGRPAGWPSDAGDWPPWARRLGRVGAGGCRCWWCRWCVGALFVEHVISSSAPGCANPRRPAQERGVSPYVAGWRRAAEAGGRLSRTSRTRTRLSRGDIRVRRRCSAVAAASAQSSPAGRSDTSRPPATVVERPLRQPRHHRGDGRRQCADRAQRRQDVVGSNSGCRMPNDHVQCRTSGRSISPGLAPDAPSTTAAEMRGPNVDGPRAVLGRPLDRHPSSASSRSTAARASVALDLGQPIRQCEASIRSASDLAGCPRPRRPRGCRSRPAAPRRARPAPRPGRARSASPISRYSASRPPGRRRAGVGDLRVRAEPGAERHRDPGAAHRPLEGPREVAVAGEPQPAPLGVADPQPLHHRRRRRAVRARTALTAQGHRVPVRPG